MKDGLSWKMVSISYHFLALNLWYLPYASTETFENASVFLKDGNQGWYLHSVLSYMAICLYLHTYLSKHFCFNCVLSLAPWVLVFRPFLPHRPVWIYDDCTWYIGDLLITVQRSAMRAELRAGIKVSLWLSVWPQGLLRVMFRVRFSLQSFSPTPFWGLPLAQSLSVPSCSGLSILTFARGPDPLYPQIVSSGPVIATARTRTTVQEMIGADSVAARRDDQVLSWGWPLEWDSCFLFNFSGMLIVMIKLWIQ